MLYFCHVYLNISDCPIVIAVVLFSVYSTVLCQCTDRWSVLLQYCECSRNSEVLLPDEELIFPNKYVDSREQETGKRPTDSSAGFNCIY